MNAQTARRHLDEIRQWATDRAHMLSPDHEHQRHATWYEIADAADDLAITIDRADARLTVRGN